MLEENNMQKKWLIRLSSIIIIAGVLSLNLYKGKSTSIPTIIKEYPAGPIVLKIDWELEKSFQLQVFYTTEQNELFNEEKSIRKQITPNDKHIEIELPVEKIYRIRLDYGSKPQRVIVKNVEITGDQYINFSNWTNYGYMHMDKNKIHKEDNSLELYSDQNDPYMYYLHPFVLYKSEKVSE